MSEEKYQAWIEKHYPTSDLARNQCQQASGKMVKQFPELTQVRGWVKNTYGETPHWWCKDQSGRILDPTAIQFIEVLRYREFQEGLDEEPIGKCLYCSDYCWKSQGAPSEWACTEECSRLLDHYYNKDLQDAIRQGIR